MAIQISGTTVVNNSRQLQNIASLDSTTTATIAAAVGGSYEIIPFDTGATDRDVALFAKNYLYYENDFVSTDQYVFPTGEGDYLAMIGNDRSGSSSWYIYLQYTNPSRIRGGWYNGGPMRGYWENGVNKWRTWKLTSDNQSIGQSSTTILTGNFIYGRTVLMRLSLGAGSDQVRFYTASNQSGGNLSVIGIS